MLTGEINLYEKKFEKYTPPSNLPVPKQEGTYACTAPGVAAARRASQARHKIGDKVYILSNKTAGTIHGWYSDSDWKIATSEGSVMETVVVTDEGEFIKTNYRNIVILPNDDLCEC